MLPAVVDPATTQNAGKPQVHDEAPDNTVYQWHLGDKAAIDAAFAAAKHVTKIDLVNNRLIPNAMEPRAAIGEYDAGTEAFTLYTTSQNPHVARLVLSAFIGIAPEHKLRVIAPDVGGGFGSKIFIYAEETVCVWAAKKVGRPVKWTADRTEAFLADAHGRDHVTHAELAIDAGGKILALRAKTKANLGAYLSTFASSVPTYLYAPLLSGQYDIPAIYCEVDGVYTNTAPVDAYRGAGRPEATFVVERLIEVAAREIGQDPAEFRRQNFITLVPAPDAGHHGLRRRRLRGLPRQGAGDGRLHRASPRARRPARPRASCAASASPPTSRPAASRPPRPSARSAPASACGNRPRCASIPTGTVEVLTGSHSHGQGHETTFAQLVSQRLGIPIEQVSIVHGDTDKVQFGMGTYGSRSGAVGMSAIFKAIDKIDRQGQEGRGLRAGGASGDGRLQGRHLLRQGHQQDARPSARWRCRPTSPTSSRASSWSPA